ncbi:hypothetical protein ABIA39_007760 [Nocardia sp. GAS34]
MSSENRKKRHQQVTASMAWNVDAVVVKDVVSVSTRLFTHGVRLGWAQL